MIMFITNDYYDFYSSLIDFLECESSHVHQIT